MAASKQTKLIYFGTRISEYEAKLDAIGECLEKMNFPNMRGNNGKISHAAVIKFLIDKASNEIKQGD